jgi:hypothetical protein
LPKGFSNPSEARLGGLERREAKGGKDGQLKRKRRSLIKVMVGVGI